MPLAEEINQPLEVEYCHRRDWSLFKEIHYHNCYEIYYLESGDITYFIDENTYRLHHGDFIVIPPDVPHKTLPYRLPNHTRFLIYLQPEFLAPILSDTTVLTEAFSNPTVVMGRERIVKPLLDRIQSEATVSNNESMLRLLIGELMLYLRRWKEQDQRFTLPQSEENTSRTYGKILEIARYIDLHYHEDLPLSEIAKRFYMSPAYLSRMFHRVMRISYRDYCIQVRIQQAAQLLMHSDKKIAEIAQETGFHSDNHFGKMFRKVMGCSPRQYRGEN